MHTILHKLNNGGVGNYPPNPKVLALMMGTGLKMTPLAMARQMYNFMQPGPPGSQWLGFSQAFATEWVAAISEGGLTEAAALDLFARRIRIRRGYAASITIDDAQLIPQFRTDRYFRDAVVWDDASPNKCSCSMPKARGIHMNNIRKSRDAELAALDTPWIKALEAGNVLEQQRIAMEKQRLRDIPQTFDLATFITTETLKAAWPANLPRPA